MCKLFFLPEFKKLKKNEAWWFLAVILEVVKLREEDQDRKDILQYTSSWKPSWAIGSPWKIRIITRTTGAEEYGCSWIYSEGALIII